MSFPPFRSIKLRSRKLSCPACGTSSGPIQTMDYVRFCGGPPPDWQKNGLRSGDPGDRVSVHVKWILLASTRMLILIIRNYNLLCHRIWIMLSLTSGHGQSLAFVICNHPLAGQVNIPCSFADNYPTDIPLKEIISNPQKHLSFNPHVEIFIVCRLGNDSQTAAQALRNAGGKVKDVIGGLRAWSNNIDKNFPIY